MMNVSGAGENAFDPELRDAAVSIESGQVLVSFEIEPESGCVLSTLGDDVDVVQHQFREERCEVVVRVGNGDETDVVRGGTIDTAVCPLLLIQDFGGSPRVKAVERDQFVVDSYFSDTQSLESLVAELDRVTEDLRVRRVVDVQADEPSIASATVDLDRLSDKQRAALEVALRRGYFERPREVTQAELAEEFDISKQAFSRRLARAERAVLEQLLLD